MLAKDQRCIVTTVAGTRGGFMEAMLQRIRNCEHLENLCDMDPLGIGEGGAAAAHYENPIWTIANRDRAPL